MTKTQSLRSRGSARGHRPLADSPDEVWRKSLAILFNLTSIVLSRADLLRRAGLSSRQLARLERGDASPADPALHAALAALDHEPEVFVATVRVIADVLRIRAQPMPPRRRGAGDRSRPGSGP